MHISDFRKVDVVVIGATPGGVAAAREVARHTDDVVLVDATRQGGPSGHGADTSLRTFVDGVNTAYRLLSQPSDASAAVTADAAGAALRRMRDGVGSDGGVPTQGIGEVLSGDVRLIGLNHVYVGGRIVEADAIVVALGERPQVPPALQRVAADIVSVDEIVDAARLPRSVAVLGLDGDGLAMAQALCRLGVRTAAFDSATGLGGIHDPDIVTEALAVFDREFPIVLGRKVDVQRAADGRLQVSAGSASTCVDKLLLTGGGRPDAAALGWHGLDIPTDRDGLPVCDPRTRRVAGTSIFIVGDPRAHPAGPQYAVLQGRTAGYNAAHRALRHVPDITPLTIAFCDPGMAAVGTPLDSLDADATVTVKHRFGTVAAASVGEAAGGMIKLYADRHTRQLRGGAMIGRGSDHLAHLLGAFVQQRLTVDDALDMPFHQPVVEEMLRDGLDALCDALQRPTAAPADGHAAGPTDAPTMRVVATRPLTGDSEGGGRA